MTTILYMAPKNGSSVSKIKFCDHFRALRLSWTANSLKNEGMEQFIDEFLPIIRYVWCRNRRRRVSWKNKYQILAAVEQLSLGNTFFDSKKRRVPDRIPFGFQISSSETLGHDVYKVFSKWKEDPVDPNEITLEKHPHYVFTRRGVAKHKMLMKDPNLEENT